MTLLAITNAADQTPVYGPFIGGFAITPSDTDTLDRYTRGLRVGVAGNVKVMMMDGSTITIQDLAVGIDYPYRVMQVFATGGTTADEILGLY